MPLFWTPTQIQRGDLRQYTPIIAGGIYVVTLDNKNGTFRLGLFVCGKDLQEKGDLHHIVLTHVHPRYPMYNVLNEYNLGGYDLRENPDVISCISVGRIHTGRTQDLRRIRRIIYEALGGFQGVHRRHLQEPQNAHARASWIGVEWWRTAMTALVQNGVVQCPDLYALEAEARDSFFQWWLTATSGLCIPVTRSVICSVVPWVEGL